jgi:hypothetical protein
VDSPNPTPDKSFCKVAQRTDGRYQLRIGGYFRSGWMATLCAGLAQRQLSIDSVQAWREEDRTWVAELTLTPLEGADDPHTLRYLDLAESNDTLAPRTLHVDRCRLHDSAEHGGTLVLTLEAVDALGLLGSVLASLATLMLFPVAMEIQTKSGRAEDRLWLTGIGGTQPSVRVRENLEHLMASWKRRI